MKILIFPKFNRGEGDNKSVIVITQGGGGVTYILFAKFLYH